MIALEGVAAKRKPLALSSVSVTWEAGTHAVVGARGDGAPLLLALVAGRARPRSGQVRVLGGSPTDAAVRRQIALVPLEPSLPEAMRVREALALAAAIRQDPARDPAATLAVLGVESLAERPVGSLSRAEARAVALAEALASPTVRVLLVEEPLLAIDPRAAGRVPEALRKRARDGGAVILATGSMRDAGELADDWIALRAGTIVGRAACVDSLATRGPDADGAVLRIVLRDATEAPALIGALTNEAEVDLVEREEGALRLCGRDATQLARALGRAALEAGVEIAQLQLEAPAVAASVESLREGRGGRGSEPAKAPVAPGEAP